ncbi:hypothetical protein DESC_940108 [Desulfosarcina cetonica]|nr:hypothetical protein DESC_940108 [Desulfosarcina cetonica]
MTLRSTIYIRARNQITLVPLAGSAAESTRNFYFHLISFTIAGRQKKDRAPRAQSLQALLAPVEPAF